MRAGALIGAIAAMWWVLSPGREGLNPFVWASFLVVVVAAGLIGVLRAGRVGGESTRGFLRNPGYWAAVAFEILLIGVGQRVLVAGGHENLDLALVLIAVGVHFFPLMWALFGRWNAMFAGIGAALTVCGIALSAARLADAPSWAFGVVGGVLPALSLTVIPLVTAVRAAQRGVVQASS